jgi:hypothetical protein
MTIRGAATASRLVAPCIALPGARDVPSASDGT